MHRHSPELVPLRTDHAYLRGAPDSAYWSIAPHLIQQGTDSSCSLATAVMLINAVRGRELHMKDYEPMWAPLPRLAKAMATLSRKTGEPRGYAVVKRKK